MESISAVFLDRDGVINRRLPGEYVRRAEEFELLPGVPQALALLRRLTRRLIVVTNQAGIGKGLMSESELAGVHERLRALAQAAGDIEFDAIYHCPHTPQDHCGCRKPATGMGERASEAFADIVFEKSWMVGDSLTDLQFGRRLGMRVAHIKGKEEELGAVETFAPDAAFDSLFDFARWIAAKVGTDQASAEICPAKPQSAHTNPYSVQDLDSIRRAIAQSIEVKQALLADPDVVGRLLEAARVLVACFQNGGKALFCGNGGSAADAQHLAAELSGRFYVDRPPLYAEALHVNTSYLTAVANDYSFESVYARMIEAAGRPGDVLIAISTSGNSPNVLAAIHKAREVGMRVVGMTGRGGGKMAPICDILLQAPSADTPRIQEAHILMGHIFCEYVEKALF
ncbi:MAG: HAD-IIIA family hydrolase [Saprospiraceae bacterium]